MAKLAVWSMARVWPYVDQWIIIKPYGAETANFLDVGRRTKENIVAAFKDPDQR